MTPHAESQALQALKTAMRMLIERLGGLDATACCVRVGRSRLADYSNRNLPEMYAPVDVVLDAERVAGEPIVTATLAREQGYQLVPVGPADPRDLIPALREAAHGASELLSAVVDALADGSISEGERQQLIRHLEELVRLGLAAQACLAAHETAAV